MFRLGKTTFLAGKKRTRKKKMASKNVSIQDGNLPYVIKAQPGYSTPEFLVSYIHVRNKIFLISCTLDRKTETISLKNRGQ